MKNKAVASPPLIEAIPQRQEPSPELRSIFQDLADKWRKETGHLSSMQAMVMSQPYQSIIGMGEPVVWLILEELKARPDHWFWALMHITRENPVPVEHSGNLMLMTADWLEWGKQHGYP
jgi:hypothetical protein